VHWLSKLWLIGALALATTNSLAQHEEIKLLLERSSGLVISKPDSAIDYATQAAALAQEQGHAGMQAKAYGMIGEIYQSQSKLKESVEAYLQGIQIAEEAEANTVLPSLYNGLGISYYHLNDPEKSEYYIRRAAELKLSQHDYTWYSVIITNLAGLNAQQGKHGQAIQMLLEARNVLIKENQEKYLTSLYNALGAAYQMGLNDLDSAEFFYKRSLELAAKYTLSENLLSGNYNLAEIAFIRKNYAAALGYLKEAESAGNAKAPDRFLIDVYRLTGETYAAMGQFAEAYSYRTKQLNLQNEIFNTEKQKAISELEIRYETSKREQELQDAKLQAEKKRSQFQIILFAFSTLALIGMGIALYYRQKRKVGLLIQQEKNKVIENIVHEIRSPLTLIYGPLQLIEQQVRDQPSLKENISLVRDSSAKLTRLVNELLDASKLEKGRYVLSWKSGDIHQFLLHEAETFVPQAEAKSISLHFDIPEQPEFCSYPSNALEKIISNLIGNAIKYSPPGSEVHIAARCVMQELIFTVSDNGIGITPQDQSRIFDRFYRVQEQNEQGGSGIGLSMVKELTQLAGGNIDLESKPGKGSKFEVRLPLRKNEDTDTSVAKEDDPRPLVLLVEDNSDIAQFAAGILRSEYRVHIAHNGEDGLQQARNQLPDLILTDILMPVMDGIEMLQQIKSDALTNHIPTIIFSAKTSLESRLETLRFGADAYIPKPFNPDELRLVIQNIMTTVRRNQERFKQNLEAELPAEERLKNLNEFVNAAVDHVLAHLDYSDYGVNELAGDLAISRSQLHRKLTALTGFSGTHFIRMVRLEKAKDLLNGTGKNVTEVAYSCGFNSQSYFTRMFTEHFGESPSSFSEKAQK
jgi:two-component system, sensor histidine kinase ChiS